MGRINKGEENFHSDLQVFSHPFLQKTGTTLSNTEKFQSNGKYLQKALDE